MIGTGGGKCNSPFERILLFDGTVKFAKDIVVNDILMGHDSTPRKVLSICNGTDEMFKIIPTKGESHTFNKDHILTLRASYDYRKWKAKDLIDISILDYLKLNNREKHCLKWARTGVEFKEKEIDFDPYFVGLYLAEGSKHYNQITNPDKEIINYLNEKFKIKTKGIDQRLYVDEKGRNLSALSKLRREICLENDRLIPDRYKINSRQNRLKLLGGLLDGDGYLHNNFFEITTKYKTLNEDILYLARSLGFAAYSSKKIATIKTLNFSGEYFRISISGDVLEIPTLIKRKQASARKQIKSVLNTGFEIIPLGKGEYFGFNINGDGRYLLSDFSITHNSFIFSLLVKEYLKLDKSILLLVNKEILLRQGHKNILKHADFDCGLFFGKKKEIKQVTVATIQSIQKKEINFDIIIFDEVHRYDLDGKYSIIKKFLSQLKYQKAIGFTATPYREKTLIYGQGKFFPRITFDKRLKQLTDEGFLVPIKYRGTKYNIDLSGVKKQGVDFSTSDLCKTIENNFDKVIMQVRDALDKSVGYKKIIVLSTSIEHAEFIYSLLENENACIIHSKLKDAEKRKAEEDFLNGDVRIMVSVLIASEGLDAPKADCLWFMRPTRSPVLFIQGAGRILRTYENKTHGLLLDYGGIVENIGELYEINDDWFNKKYKRQKIYQCESCDFIFPTTRYQCPECGKDVELICVKCDKPYIKKDGCICRKKEKEALRSISNLTIDSFDGDKKIKEVEIGHAEAKSHINKNGNQSIMIIFFKSWFLRELACMHFINYYNYKIFFEALKVPVPKYNFEILLKEIKENLPRIKSIYTTKNNGYNTLLGFTLFDK